MLIFHFEMLLHHHHNRIDISNDVAHTRLIDCCLMSSEIHLKQEQAFK